MFVKDSSTHKSENIFNLFYLITFNMINIINNITICNSGMLAFLKFLNTLILGHFDETYLALVD
jgi:hypothetical protein